MPIPYLNIARQIALKTGQFGDRITASDFNALFEGALTDGVTGLEIPLGALKLAILASEARIAALVADQPNQLLRRVLAGKSAEIEHAAQLPIVDRNNVPFVGTIGAVFDADTDRAMTRKPLQTVMRRAENAGDFYKLEQFYFCIEDDRVFHTRTAVYFTGCVWSREIQSDAYDDDGESPLPDSLENFLIADVLANLPQEDWFVQEAETYRRLAKTAENELKGGREPLIQLPE